MPIHLTPLSRRQFLTATLATGASLLLQPRLLAAEKRVNAHSWALLADTHVAADRATVARNTNMADNLAAAGRELAALEPRPSGVLINGDCAYLKGEPGDYATLADLLQPIRQAGLPVHLTLGNHDDREHFRSALEQAGAARPMADKHVAILRSPRANWFLLDSLELVNKTPGLLGAAQLQWLADSLDANTDRPAIIFAHHNLEETPKNGLKDTEKLLEILRPRRHVKAYMYGHTHNWNVQQDASGLHLINLPPVAYVFNNANPSGWVHATLQKDGVRLELRALDSSHPGHGQKQNLKWRQG
jgi:3',5'-cyclic-AMP phosphodiesterase